MLTLAPGLFLFILALLCGCVEHDFFNGPALIVILKGRFARWMGRERDGQRFFYAHTIGPFCFFYREPDDQTVRHERQHCFQQMVLGPFQPLFYALFWIYGRFETGNAYQAYRQNPFERDARRVAGEE
jgi:hypothetical protein